MRKKIILIVFILMIAIASFILSRNHDGPAKQTKFYPVKERKGTLAQLPEWKNIKRQGDILLEKMKADPADKQSKLALVALFIQEGRITGDHLYYDMASMKYLDEILAVDSSNFDALVYKAVVELSEHHFDEARTTATLAKNLNPYNAFVHGLLVDANLELGMYSQAVEYADQMVSIRPDLRSYSRVSYLREVYGDLPGAIEAMEMAVDAGVPGDEATEWCRVQLGHLYLKAKQTEKAAMQFHLSLQERPAYPYAIVGLGKVEAERKNFAEAAIYLQSADSMLHDIAFKEELALLYDKMGDASRANNIYNEIITYLIDHSADDYSATHHADLELAELYLHTGDFASALRHASYEYKRRPDNIEVNETLAWAYHKNGDKAKAAVHMKKAMATNCKDPVLLERAALVRGY